MFIFIWYDIRVERPFRPRKKHGVLCPFQAQARIGRGSTELYQRLGFEIFRKSRSDQYRTEIFEKIPFGKFGIVPIFFKKCKNSYKKFEFFFKEKI